MRLKGHIIVSLQANNEFIIYCCSFKSSDLPFLIDIDLDMILHIKSDSLKLLSGISFCILYIKFSNISFKLSMLTNDGTALILIFSDSKSKSKPNWFRIFLLDFNVSISTLEKSITIGWSNFCGLTLFNVSDFRNLSYKILWCALSWLQLFKITL